MACKPDFVPRCCHRLDDHSSERPVTSAPLAANPGLIGSSVPARISFPITPARGPYLALLPVGLAVPLWLPIARWALTPPFHLFPACRVVCSLWRFPWSCPRRALPGTVLCGVRTFLERCRPRPSSHPRDAGLRPVCPPGQRGNGGRGSGLRPGRRVRPALGPKAGTGAGRR